MTKNKNTDLTKNTVLFAISNLGPKLISFFLVPLYTTVLSTDEFGVVDIITTTIALILPILTLNIQDAVFRFSFDKNCKPEDTIDTAIKIIIVSSVLLGSALTIIKLTGLIDLETKFLFFLWISFFFNSLSNSIQMYLKAKDKIKVIVASGLVSSFVVCISNIILLTVLKIGINGYLISLILGSFISVAVCLIFGSVYKEFKLFTLNKTLLKSMVKYSAPLILNSVAWWINSGIDKYILTFFDGTSVEGIYAVASKIPNILSIFQSIFYNAWAISAIRDFDKNDTDGYIGNTYTIYSFVSIVGCSLLIIANPFISFFLYKNDFYIANNYVPALLIGTMFNGMALVEGCLYAAVKRTTIITYSTIIGAVINTILNFTLIPYFGATGAAFATLIGYLIVWIIRTANLHRIISIKCNWTAQIVSIALIITQLLIFSFKLSLSIQIVVSVALIIIQIYTSKTILKEYLKSLIAINRRN